MESAWGKSLFYFIFDYHFSLLYSWKFNVEMKQISLFLRSLLWGDEAFPCHGPENWGYRQGDTDLNFKLHWPKTWAGFTLISELTMHGVLIQYIILIWFNVVYEQLILDQDYDWVLCLWKAVAGVWIACVGMIVPYWKRSDIINIVQTLTTLNLQQREGFCQYELLLSDDADC